jgi:hypothetical protein
MRHLLLALLCLPAIALAQTASMKGQVVHLYDVVYGFTAEGVPNAPIVCSAPGTQLYVTDDDGTSLIVSVDRQGNTKYPVTAWCANSYLSEGTLYTIAKSALTNERMTAESFVAGALTVPFKMHLSDHGLTAGSTIGAYVGYRSSFFNDFTITPILAGGLALVSTAPIGSSTEQTSTGFSLATGLIGSVGQSGMQYGVVLGADWLGEAARYRYEGRPWLSLEIGYSFSQ